MPTRSIIQSLISLPSLSPLLRPHALLRGCLLALLLWLSPTLHAKGEASQIFLLSEQKDYKAGENITAYVFFFRMNERLAFFQAWERVLQGNATLDVQKRERLSVLREMTPSGEEVYHGFYRLTLTPRQETGILQYGPLQIDGSTSNLLRFSPRSVSQAPPIQSSATLSTQRPNQGQETRISFRLRCPRVLCDYKNIEINELLNHLRQKARLLDTEGLWIANPSVIPHVQQEGTHAEISYAYLFRPLRSGRINAPRLQVPIPILQTSDQRVIRERVIRWLHETHKIPLNQARRYLRLDRELLTRVTFSTLTTPSLPLSVSPAPALMGRWTLRSRLVIPQSSSLPHWEVALQGDGFLLLAAPAFRQRLEAILAQHKRKDLRLVHTAWRLPRQDLQRQVEIAYYFALPPKRPTLPALSMDFLDEQGKTYTQTQPAIQEDARAIPLNEGFASSKESRRLYLYFDRTLTTKQTERADVWSYQLPEGFPAVQMLEARWQLASPLQLQAARKFKNITQRHQSRGGFGMFMQISTRSVPIDVETGSVEAKLHNSPLAAVFPTVYWGDQRIDAHEETGSGLTISASTDRERYLVGESIEYRFVIRCPAGECSPQDAGFYKGIFQRHLKLPSFDRFGGWQKLDDFTRREEADGSTSFTYRIRFKTTQIGEIKIDPVSLRLPDDLLRGLLQQKQICLFRGGRAEGRILDAIARDHLNVQAQSECETGTQELQTTPLRLTLEALPPEASGVQLIGNFRIQTTLTQLTYPAKQATLVDKPFYLLVDVSGDGDLATAQQILQDQLARLSNTLRKQDVTAYTEIPPDEQKPDRIRLQLQLIAEQPTKLTLPSIQLRHYHREEGLLTAQTLPLTVLIEPREDRAAPREKTPKPTTPAPTALLQETDLRPNRVIATHLDNEAFFLLSLPSLIFLSTPPLLFLLFGGFLRFQRKRQEDPEGQRQRQALHSLRQALRQASTSQHWQRDALQALQNYFSERLRLQQKNLTSEEIAQSLERHWPDAKKESSAQALPKHVAALEDALYGGGARLEKQSTLDEIEKDARRFDGLCPR